MKKPVSLFVLVLSLSLIFAATNAGGAEIKSAIELSNGYRVDRLDWNIAGNLAGTNPNVLSELTWRDIEIYQFNIGLKALINEGFYVRGNLWDMGGSLMAGTKTRIFKGTIEQGSFLAQTMGRRTGTLLTLLWEWGTNSRDIGKAEIHSSPRLFLQPTEPNDHRWFPDRLNAGTYPACGNHSGPCQHV